MATNWSSPFFLPLSLSSLLPLASRKTRGLSSFYERLHKGQNPQVIESPFYGSYSLRWLYPSVISVFSSHMVNPSRSRNTSYHMNMKKRRVSLYSVNRSTVLFRIMSLLINIASFENRFLLSLSICAKSRRHTTRITILSIETFFDCRK